MAKKKRVGFIIFKDEDADKATELLEGKGFKGIMKIFMTEDFKEITELLEKNGIEYFLPASRYN